MAASLDYTKKFATVLGPSASQSDVFRTVGLPLVEATLKGHRTCLFAYGQTGAGKTFSMYGAEGGRNPSKLDGVVPTICAEFFRRKQEIEKAGKYRLSLSVTLFEVQGSLVADLLADTTEDGEQPALKMRGGEVLESTRERIYSSRGLSQCIELGM